MVDELFNLSNVQVLAFNLLMITLTLNEKMATFVALIAWNSSSTQSAKELAFKKVAAKTLGLTLEESEKESESVRKWLTDILSLDKLPIFQPKPMELQLMFG